MLVVFDRGVHSPVQPFKLHEAHDEPRLLCAGHEVTAGHAEDRVQDVDLHIGAQRREDLEVFAQLLLATPGYVGDEEITSLRAFVIPRFVWVFTMFAFNGTVRPARPVQTTPTRFTNSFFIRRRLVVRAPVIRGTPRLYLRRRPIL
ncbi:MAG: hypothetical protein M3362_12925 [Acidobacteriota bacterium]|nr:hypothetical protein [Acidobacteriota bacterium]